MIFPTPKKGPFKGEDLQVYQEGFCGPLPFNGIREKAFSLIEEFYCDLVLGRTQFQLQSRIAHLVHSDFKMLLLRPMGRRLLLAISKRVDICFGKEACVWHKHKTVRYNPEKTREGKLYFLSRECRFVQEKSYFTLAHELIHVLNGKQGRKWAKCDPTEGSIYKNLDEQIVITCKGAPSTYHGISTNGIRIEHGLPKRYGHYGTWSDHPMFIPHAAYFGEVRLLVGVDRQRLFNFFVMVFAVSNDQLPVLLHLEGRGIKYEDTIVHRIASQHSAVRILNYLNGARVKNLKWLKALHQHRRRSLPTLRQHQICREE